MPFLIPLQQAKPLLCYFIVRVFENFQLLEQVMPQKQCPICVIAAILAIIGIIPQAGEWDLKQLPMIRGVLIKRHRFSRKKLKFHSSMVHRPGDGQERPLIEIPLHLMVVVGENMDLDPS